MKYELEFPPIVIFGYRRRDALALLWADLCCNANFSKHPVFLYLDGANGIDDEEDVHQVSEFSDFLQHDHVTVVQRPKNFGLANNIISAVTDILKTYEAVIVLEDDLRLSPFFLDYMRASLKFYASEESVGGISGFSLDLPYSRYLENDNYFLRRPSSWGWAIWKDRWSEISWNPISVNEFVANILPIYMRSGPDVPRMYFSYLRGLNNSWAIRWCWHVFRRRQIIAYPRDSLVANMGFNDHRSTHCSGRNYYETHLTYDRQSDFFELQAPAQLRVLLSLQFWWRYSLPCRILMRLKEVLHG
ncbi:hypothetical protein ACMAY9_03135 [Porticoccaceae bacterium nBUS_09]